MKKNEQPFSKLVFGLLVEIVHFEIIPELRIQRANANQNRLITDNQLLKPVVLGVCVYV